MKSSSRIRADFARIAAVSAATDEGSTPLDHLLLSFVPPDCRRLLDLGCGTGRLTRMLAARADEVTAVDFSPEMLRVARERSRGGAIRYVEADVLDLPHGLGSFDCVISVNLLHHLPLDRAVGAMQAVLAPGGRLIVHDLRKTAGLVDRALDVPRLALKAASRLRRVSGVRTYLRQRRAWAHHARCDVIPTAAEIANMRDRFFPGAVVHQHFLWRYTLLWTKSAGGPHDRQSLGAESHRGPRPGL